MLGPLTPIQLRVLGALAEKAATVPDTYPMTLNGLRTACNQKNSREPVSDYGDAELRATLDDLKAAGLVRFVHASHGARTTKFRHVLDDALDLTPAELAVLTVLMLRGPQTVNEVRTRTERAHPFADNDEVAAVLDGLATGDRPLVVEVGRQPGEKQDRWMHLLGGPALSEQSSPAPDGVAADAGVDDERPPIGDLAAADPADGADVALAVATPTTPTLQPPSADAIGALVARIVELEERVATLEALLED